MADDAEFDFFRVEYDDSGLRLSLDKLAAGTRDQSDVLGDFYRRMVTRIDRTFELAGGPSSASKGGYDPFRDITWEPLAPQRRRIDGREIPAWGGTRRKDGKGKVKGRLRASGRRVQKTDALNQDTGRFRQRAATGFVAIGRNSITFGPNLNYSSRLESLRPAVFIAESDAALLQNLLMKKLLDEDFKEDD